MWGWCGGSCAAPAAASAQRLWSDGVHDLCSTYEIEAVARGCEKHPRSGRPIANTRIYVLDAASATGADRCGGRDLHWRSGSSVGYLNRPELTAERFVRIPSVAIRRAGCTRREIWGGGERMGRSSTWDATIIR